MRTPEQIGNFRNVLTMQIGLAARFISDEVVNAIADNLQDRIDSEKYNWEVKVKFVNSSAIDWALIKKEKSTPCCSIKEIRKKGRELLAKYPTIDSIRVNIVSTPEDGIVITR